MKRYIYNLSAAILSFLIGVAVTAAIRRNGTPQIEPLQISSAEVQLLHVGHSQPLSLCELGQSVSFYNGKEVFISATYISRLSAQAFEIVSECRNENSVAARVTLTDHPNLPRDLLVQLVAFMSAEVEKTDTIVGQVTIKGQLDDRDPGASDFLISASDIRVEFYHQKLSSRQTND